MVEEHTTAAAQRYLNALAEDKRAEPIMRALTDRSVLRLQLRCASLLHRKYCRSTLPPLNLRADEMFDAVVKQ